MFECFIRVFLGQSKAAQKENSLAILPKCFSLSLSFKMSDESPRPRTRGQTTALLLRKIARNPTQSVPDVLNPTEIVDLGETSSKKSHLRRSNRKNKQVTIEEVFTGSRSEAPPLESESLADVAADTDDEDEGDMQVSSEQNRDEMEPTTAADQVAADSEDEEVNQMEEDDQVEFVYEDLETRIEELRSHHQARVAATPSL